MTLRQMDIWEYMSDRGILYGKTSQERSVPTVERTLGLSSKKSAKSQTKTPLFLDLRGSGNRQDVSWETDGVSLGEHMMHNTGEFRKDEREFVFSLISGGEQQEKYYLNCSEKPLMEKKIRLSDILEESANPKYNLSAKACEGILRRANARGKKLPEVLEKALIAQSHLKNEPGKQGGVKESLSKTSEPERSVPCQTRMKERSLFSKIEIYKPNGDNGGGISFTLVGDHNDRVTHYTNLITGDREMDNTVVRRLTPMECERLQGFPDGWTDIGDWVDSKGKKHKGESDSPRYKALGNSIALPFWEWMAERMVAQLREDGVDNPTMASLFDGIGGFPLVFQRNGCKPVWASEIEEFPMAVTKIRFLEGE